MKNIRKVKILLWPLGNPKERKVKIKPTYTQICQIFEEGCSLLKTPHIGVKMVELLDENENSIAKILDNNGDEIRPNLNEFPKEKSLNDIMEEILNSQLFDYQWDEETWEYQKIPVSNLYQLVMIDA